MVAAHVFECSHVALALQTSLQEPLRQHWVLGKAAVVDPASSTVSCNPGRNGQRCLPGRELGRKFVRWPLAHVQQICELFPTQYHQII